VGLVEALLELQRRRERLVEVEHVGASNSTTMFAAGGRRATPAHARVSARSPEGAVP
jgi:hypothetical protein